MTRVLPFLLLPLLVLPVRAQPSTMLEPFTPVTGQIESGEREQWMMTGVSGQVISLAVESISGDLDPELTVVSGSGTTLISNDDYNYPDSTNSLLEAITLPRTDTYIVTVSGANGTSGDYTLRLLSGYSQIEQFENFNGDVQLEASSTLTTENRDGALVLSLEGQSQTGIAYLADSIGTPYYAQVAIAVPENLDMWTVGMSSRQTNADNYYFLIINERGEWRFSVFQGGTERILRDWTPHPAIVVGSRAFTLGLLVNGSGFEFFYNGQFIGRQVDSSLSEDGAIGFGVQTGMALNSRITAAFDDLAVTTPLLVNEQPVLPQQLIISAPTSMAEELQRRNLIPVGGEMALTVGQSFVERGRPGVERYMLGRGLAFQTFALGTTVSWEATASGVTGCGLIFGAVDDMNYILAYLDQTGGYGVSQRIGDSFLPGIFGNRPLNQTSHHLLIISQPNQVLYYVDGLYSGTLKIAAAGGMVGNAVVNFEPISTSCQFSDTWLWRWD